MAGYPRARAALDDIRAYRAGSAAPVGAYKLSSNENPFPPLPGVLAAINDAAASINRYPDFNSVALMTALANRHGVEEDLVALGTGSVAVLAQTMQVMAGPGDEVIVPWRSFEAYPVLARLTGASLVKVPLLPDFRLDLPAMAAAVTEKTRVVVVCTPNNPTGTLVPPSELSSLLSEVRSDVLVAVDEAYIEFTDDPSRNSVIDLVGQHENLMVLRTFSKAYGLAGLRVGYAIAPPSIAQALRKAQLPFGVTRLAETAALASLSGEAELLRRVAAVVAERDRVVEALTEMKVGFPRPHANFVWLPLGERATEFADLAAQHGIVVRAFASDGVRVTIGESAANDRLLAAVKAHQAVAD